MIQTGAIESSHSDLVTDAAYDFYGLKLATCSLDQRIKVWKLDENTRSWTVEDDWKAHDAAVSRLSWAHPEFGPILASASYDRTVKIWEQVIAPASSAAEPALSNGASSSSAAGVGKTNSGASGAAAAAGQQQMKWVERTVLVDARGTVRAVEFAPRHFGLKLATISSDSHLRIYECLEQASLKTWQLLDEIDVSALSPLPMHYASSSKSHTHIHTYSLSTPTQTGAAAYEGGASASLVAQALMANQASSASSTSLSTIGRTGVPGNKEADGGWCVSWCKGRYWGEVVAVACGTTGLVHVIQLTPSRRPTVLLTLDPSPQASDQQQPGTLPSTDAGLQANSAPSNQFNLVPPPQLQSSLSTTSTASGQTQLQQQGQQGQGQQQQQRKAPVYAITTISWAPSCGRSYHLVATGGRDGRVRIWRVKPAEQDDGEDEDDGEEGGAGGGRKGEDADSWSASVVADFGDHKSAVGRVEWNVIGTVLSSVGNDGLVRLWKSSAGNIWRAAGTIGVEHEPHQDSHNNEHKRRSQGGRAGAGGNAMDVDSSGTRVEQQRQRGGGSF